MGFKTFGFAGGRADVWEPEELYWGPEGTWLGDERYSGERQLAEPLGAVQMGLIYVNPEGPNGNPDPLAAAQGHPRDLLPHGDERRRDRRADRRRPHLRQDPWRGRSVAGRPGAGRRRASRIRASAGRASTAPALAPTPSPAVRKSPGRRRRPSGATTSSTTCSKYEWELTKSPAGAKQWKAKGRAKPTIPDAFDTSKKHVPTMLTTDLALRFDPAYEKISRRFYEHPDQFADAFARAWFKLTHRDMGPRRALPRPAGAEGNADLAGPDPGRRPCSRSATRTSPR